MFHESEFLHNLVSNEMFLDNSFNHNGVSGPVPNTLGIDQQDGTFGADPETVGKGIMIDGIMYQVNVDAALLQNENEAQL